MQYEKLNVPSLIDRCASKDALAWAEFVKRFSPLTKFSIKKALAKYSAYAGQAREDIKDIEQGIMLHLWNKNKFAEIKNRENINYYLVITARNAVLNHLKSRRKEILIAEESGFEKFTDKTLKRETGDAGREDLDEKIKKICGLLSAREKIIFKLYFRKELGLKAIAKIMGVPLGTISSAVTRMRKKIWGRFTFP